MKLKKIIDIVLGLSFLLLLGYSFIPGAFHEILGILFIVGIVLHNMMNKKWYKVLRKGTYDRKRKLATIINILLIVDIAVLAITGIINSRYLFNTGIHIAAIGQIHEMLAVIGFILITFHILVHIFSHTKLKYKWLPAVVSILTVIFAVILYTWLLPYLKRHFNTVEINSEAVISGERIDLGDRKIATVYFTRLGNSNFDDDVAAVSGASLMLNEEDRLMGNSQVIAQMIQNAVGGEIIAINVKNKYPSSYSDTVSAASDEINSDALPELVNMPADLGEYDTVFLVYPLWWWTIPKPVESFLHTYDFSGKTVIPVVTHGGSGVGESIKDIESFCNGTVIEKPLGVYCDDIPYCRDDVSEWLKEIAKLLTDGKN